MDYYINVTGKITKKFIINADSQEQAIMEAANWFLGIVTEENEDPNCVNNIIIELEDDDLDEEQG